MFVLKHAKPCNQFPCKRIKNNRHKRKYDQNLSWFPAKENTDTSLYIYIKANRRSLLLSGTAECLQAADRLASHLSLSANGRGSCHQRSAKCYQNKALQRLSPRACNKEGGHTQVEWDLHTFSFCVFTQMQHTHNKASCWDHWASLRCSWWPFQVYSGLSNPSSGASCWRGYIGLQSSPSSSPSGSAERYVWSGIHPARPSITHLHLRL